MRVGRVRGSTAAEARSGVKRIQRALAAREAELERTQAHLSEHLQALVATLREMSALATEHAGSLDDLRLHQSGRFDVLARVHGMLLRDRGEPLDLETLAWDELTAAISPCESERVTISGPPAPLDRRSAELLALALHELTENAVKFGALADDEGRVDLSWSIASGPVPMLHLIWLESGSPIEPRLPVRRGFGRELIETVLPRRLRAQTRFVLSASGLRCEIDAPLVALTSHGSAPLSAAA